MKNIFLTAKSASLNQRRVLAFLLMVTITLALTPRLAGATDQVPFKASLATEFVAFPDGSNPCLLHVEHTGVGKASHLGKSTEVTTDQVGNLCTGAVTATSVHTAANGDTVRVEFIGSALPLGPSDPPNMVRFGGNYTITGGTGRFEGATGGGTFSGSAIFTGPGATPGSSVGIGSFTEIGTISSPGSAK